MRLLPVVLLSLLSVSVRAEMPTIQLKVSGHILSAEVAYTQKYRTQGLMYRNEMNKDSGMLFVFPETGRHSMWMVNTYIPLSIAFLDGTGTILNIIDMSPRTKTKHSAASAAKYALEMNLGWFRARKIKTGQQITGLERAPTAK